MVAIDAPFVVAHEFLGHAFGKLYDRYGYPKSTWPMYESYMKTSNLRSNCTDNSLGEAFWKEAGVPVSANAFAGCTTGTLYAPSNPKTCPSIMGSGSCNSGVFDEAEQWWIEKNILPQYASCSPSASPSPPTPPTSASTFCKGNAVYKTCTGPNCTDELQYYCDFDKQDTFNSIAYKGEYCSAGNCCLRGIIWDVTAKSCTSSCLKEADASNKIVGYYCTDTTLFASYGSFCGTDKAMGSCVEKGEKSGDNYCAKGSTLDCNLYCVADSVLPNGSGCCSNRVCQSGYCSTEPGGTLTCQPKP